MSEQAIVELVELTEGEIDEVGGGFDPYNAALFGAIGAATAYGGGAGLRGVAFGAAMGAVGGGFGGGGGGGK